MPKNKHKITIKKKKILIVYTSDKSARKFLYYQGPLASSFNSKLCSILIEKE